MASLTLNLEKISEYDDDSGYGYDYYYASSSAIAYKPEVTNLLLKKDGNIIFDGDDNGQLQDDLFLFPETPFEITILRNPETSEYHFYITSEYDTESYPSFQGNHEYILIIEYEEPNTDSDSLTADEIINYLMTTPYNTNKNVLKSMIADLENKDEIIAYTLNTPHNMNRKVLESLIGEGDENDDKISIKTIIVSQNGFLLEGSDFNSAADVYAFLENNGTDYLIVKDFDQKVYVLDYKGLDSYNYIYNGGQEFQITISNSNIKWFSND